MADALASYAIEQRGLPRYRRSSMYIGGGVLLVILVVLLILLLA
jgi:Tfp pilus assembly protein PilN